MLDILKNFDAAENGKATKASLADAGSMRAILESFNAVSEAPMPVPMDQVPQAPAGMPAPQDPGQPVTMNVNVSASGKDHVADLLNLMKMAGVDAPAGGPKVGDAELDIDLDGDNQPDIALQPKEEGLEEADEDMKSKILDWVKKYETRIGNNGDTLPEGFLQYKMSSGIFSDAYDQDETAKAEKMIGKPYTEWDYDDQAKALDMMPVTKAMFDEIEQITGTDGEDAAEIVADVVDNMEESSGSDEDLNSIRRLSGLEEVVVGGNAQPEDPDSVFARLMSDISEIQNAAMDGNDMADDIADELGDYLRNGDAPEGSHYEKAIGIVMDAIHDGPQAQAEAAEEAISFLHSAEEESRGNNEEYANEPDEEYGTFDDAIPAGDDLHKKKKAYRATAGGDNPMATESIKQRLLKALAEKKMPMGPGPDGKKGTDDDKPAFLNQKTGAKKSKSDKKGGGMTDKQKKYFGKK